MKSTTWLAIMVSLLFGGFSGAEELDWIRIEGESDSAAFRASAIQAVICRPDNGVCYRKVLDIDVGKAYTLRSRHVIEKFLSKTSWSLGKDLSTLCDSVEIPQGPSTCPEWREADSDLK